MRASRLNVKSAVWRCAAAVLIALLTSAPAAAQTGASDVRELKFGKSAERKIKTGELHGYKLALRRGQVLFAELDERGFDGKVELVEAAGRKTVASINLGTGFERETLTFEAPEAGDYLLQVGDAEGKSVAGAYRLSARVADAASERDRARAEAERLLAGAAAAQKENTAVKIREAIAAREKALALWRVVGDRYWESHTLNRLGGAHNALSENNRAIEYLDRSWPIVKELGDPKLEAVALNDYGWMLNGFGEYGKALEYFERALKLFQSERYGIGTASALTNIGRAHAGLKDFAKANEFYERSLAVARQEQNKNWEANSLLMLGTVFEERKEPAKALDHYGRALALWRELKHDSGVATASLKLGQAYLAQGEHDKAAAALNEALGLFKAEKLRGGETDARNALFRVYGRTGKDAEGVELLKQSLAYYQEFKIRALEISISALIAAVQNKLGNSQDAIKYAELCLATEESVPERIAEPLRKIVETNIRVTKAAALRTLGSVYHDAGDGEKALGYLARSLTVFEKSTEEDAQLQIILSLNTMAQIYRQRYDWAKARETYDRILKIARGLEEKSLLVQALNSYGIIYDSTGEERKALRYYEEALVVLRASPERSDLAKRGESALLGNIGGIYLSMGDPQKALRYYEEALAVAQSIKDPRYIDQQAAIYQHMADFHALRGEHRKALELLNKALELFRQAPPHIKALARNRTTEARLLGRIGSVHAQTGNLREAAEHFERVLKAAVEVNDLELESSALNSIAQLNLTRGEPQEALKNFNRALDISRKIEDISAEMVFHNNISLVHSYWEDTEEALKHVSASLALAERLGNRLNVATFLGNTGTIHKGLSENEKALDYFNRALALARELGNKSTEATTLNNLASLYSGMGERGKAVELYEEALAITRSTGEKNREATVLGNMAFDYLELGENQKALELRQQALTISRETGDKVGQIGDLTGIGNVYRKMGEQEKNPARFAQALASYEQALALSTAAESKAGEATALYGIGQVYVETGETAKALAPLTRALDYSRRYQNRLLEDLTHFALGRLHERAGRLDEAAAEYVRALTVARAVSDRDVEAKALTGLMSVWRARGDARRAIFYGKQAVNTFQHLRGSIRNLRRESQEVFRDKVTDTYRELSALLIEHDRFAEAEQILGLLKEAEFRSLQVRQAGGNADTIPYSTAEAEALAKVEKLVALEREWAALLKLPEDSLSDEQRQRRAQLRLDLGTANAALDDALNLLARKELDEKVAKRADYIRSEASIQGALGRLGRETNSRVVALYTVLGRDREKDQTGSLRNKFGWVVMYTEKGSKAYPIDVTNLNDLVFRFRQALGSDQHDAQPLAQKIYAALFRQTSRKQSRTLEADLREYMGEHGGKTLMWSLDGVLRYVPMAALHDGESYLVEEYRHVVLSRHSPHSLSAGNQPEWRVLGLGVSEARENFSALPGVKTELETIVREPNSPNGIFEGAIRLNQNFKKQPFLDAVSGGAFPVVHIASHYSFNPTAPATSFLLIGDGRLTFSEMKTDRNLFGEVDLLTLSACDTAMSANGEESEGFAFLAQELGAKAVLASLWKVSDAGTAELMTRFYRLRAAEAATPKGEAFRKAQLSLLYGSVPAAERSAPRRRGASLAGIQLIHPELQPFVKDERRPFAHPHYWASFVLVGNWK